MTGLSFKHCQFDKAIILMAIRWYCAYRLSDRDIEELLAERGGRVDHSTINRWVIQYKPHPCIFSHAPFTPTDPANSNHGYYRTRLPTQLQS